MIHKIVKKQGIDCKETRNYQIFGGKNMGNKDSRRMLLNWKWEGKRLQTVRNVLQFSRLN
jgi:hypothetical protein